MTNFPIFPNIPKLPIPHICLVNELNILYFTTGDNISLGFYKLEKKLYGNYTRMLRAVSNKSWRQHPTKQQLYGHLPPISKTIHVRRTRHAGHCWKTRETQISNVLLWTPSHVRAKFERPARTYLQQLCADTRCNQEDLPGAMDDRDGWRERVRDICASSVTWWWWWWCFIKLFFKSNVSFNS